ncbi:MAG: DEAD/DEAH box helicase [Vagococcus sp.]
MKTNDVLPTVWQDLWEESKFESFTPVQTALFEPLKNKNSVLGISPTGSGKTLAYLLPLLLNVEEGKGNQLLILLPSQELASQVAQVARTWAKPLGLNVQTILGGANIRRQLERLKDRPEVLVGTPGRVLELIKSKKIKAHLIHALVLDEIDDLVSNNDYNAAKSVMKSMQGDIQTVGVSATGQVVLPELDHLFKTEPDVIDVTAIDDTKGAIAHRYILTPTRKRTETLRRLVHIKDFKGLVFFNQLSEMGVVSERLDFLGVEHRTLASDQHQVERKAAIQDFEDGTVSFLLTTDIGSRGLDFSDLYYVVQYDIPTHNESYIHRSGRVGRMGKKGAVITLVNDRELRELKKMARTMDYELSEVFASHGTLLEVKPEKVEEENPEKPPKAKKISAAPKAKQSEPVKKKKKKNRTNRNKNKGAHWK